MPSSDEALRESKVPDFSSPFIGFRVWQIRRHRGKLGLRYGRYGLFCPYRNRFWHLDSVTEAECIPPDKEWRRVPHEPPGSNCTCGLYAYNSLTELRTSIRPMTYLPLAVGLVLGWGRIVQHEKGWRAQYAKPVAIAEPPRKDPLLWFFIERYSERKTRALVERSGLPLVPWYEIEEYALQFGIAAA